MKICSRMNIGASITKSGEEGFCNLFNKKSINCAKTHVNSHTHTITWNYSYIHYMCLCTRSVLVIWQIFHWLSIFFISDKKKLMCTFGSIQKRTSNMPEARVAVSCVCVPLYRQVFQAHHEWEKSKALGSRKKNVKNFSAHYFPLWLCTTITCIGNDVI